MDVRAQLEQFQKNHPGCAGVVLGDLSSGTVLCAASDKARQQEWHDDLLAECIDLLCFGLPDAEEGEWAVEAISLTEEESRLFVLAEAPAAEAVCMVADSKTQALAASRDDLAELLTEIGCPG